jgi:hypothetical protein
MQLTGRQLGSRGAPQTFLTPPPPHVSPAGQSPQVRTPPQPSPIRPQYCPPTGLQVSGSHRGGAGPLPASGSAIGASPGPGRSGATGSPAGFRPLGTTAGAWQASGASVAVTTKTTTSLSAVARGRGEGVRITGGAASTALATEYLLADKKRVGREDPPFAFAGPCRAPAAWPPGWPTGTRAAALARGAGRRTCRLRARGQGVWPTSRRRRCWRGPCK